MESSAIGSGRTSKSAGHRRVPSIGVLQASICAENLIQSRSAVFTHKADFRKLVEQFERRRLGALPPSVYERLAMSVVISPDKRHPSKPHEREVAASDFGRVSKPFPLPRPGGTAALTRTLEAAHPQARGPNR
jgi:hypothetical protein